MHSHSPSLSVVICTHDARGEYLRQVLEGLRSQGLDRASWELLVVDNASVPPLPPELHPSWHPRGRVVAEPTLGKIHAVLRGIAETQGDLVILVDDDNVLAPDYLERARDIALQRPELGTWGASIEGCFESPPPEWLPKYETYLSVRPLDRDRWFNLTDPSVYGLLPYGAGLCVRRVVAEEYRRQVANDPVRRGLGRRGDSLISSEDTDLVLVGCDLGLGTGSFAALRLKHLIPAGRLSEAYMERMLRDQTYSLMVLAARRGHPSPHDSIPRRLWGLWCALRRGHRELRFHRAAARGIDDALGEIRSWR